MPPEGTKRQEMIELLRGREMTARDLSQALGIREKEVYHHLPHLARTASAQGLKLVALPFDCLSCGYTFDDRKRYDRPGRCPRCKGGHLEEPAFTIR